MGLERSQHHGGTADRLVGPDFGNGLHANILCLAHDVFKISSWSQSLKNFSLYKAPLKARLVKLGAENVVLTLADEPTVDLIKIGRWGFLWDPADFFHEFFHIADNAAFGAFGCHARVFETVGGDLERVEVIEEQDVVFSGGFVRRDAGGEEDHHEQKWEHDI